MRYRWIAALGIFFILAFAGFFFYQQNQELLDAQVRFFGTSFPLLSSWLVSISATFLVVAGMAGLKLFKMRRAGKSMKRDADAQLARAQDLMQIENLIEHRVFKTALEMLGKFDNDSPRLTALRASAQQGLGDHDTAIQTLRNGFRATKSPLLGFNLVDALMDDPTSSDEVLHLLDALIAMEPASIRARTIKLDVLERQEAWPQAMQLLTTLEPQLPELHQERFAGYRYEYLRSRFDEEGQSKALITQIQELIGQRPDFVPAHTLLADVHLSKGDVKRAFDVLERGYEETNHSIFLVRLERYYVENDRPQDAIQIYRQISVRRGADEVAYQLGKLYQKLEMMTESFEVFEPLAHRAADSASLTMHICDLLARRNQAGEAYERLRAFIARHTDLDRDYFCQSCQARHESWAPRCGECGTWNSLQLELCQPVVETSSAEAPIYY